MAARFRLPCRSGGRRGAIGRYRSPILVVAALSVVASCLPPCLAPCLALEAIRIDAALLEGEGWSAEGVEVRLDWDAEGRPRVTGRADRVVSSAPGGPVEALTVRCEGLRFTPARIECPRGRIGIRHPWLDPGAARWSIRYPRDGGALDLRVAEVAVAGGRIGLDLRLDGAAWRLGFEAAGLDPGRLPRDLLPAAEAHKAALPELRQGRVDAEGRCWGAGTELRRLDLALRFSELGFSDAAGLNAGEGLAGTLTLDARRRGKGLEGELRLAVDAGEALFDPVYLQPETFPWHLSGHFAGDPRGSLWRLRDLRIEERGRFSVGGEALLDVAASQPLRSAELDLKGALGELYQAYAAPFLHPGDQDAGSRAAGRVEARLELAEGLPRRVRIQLDGVKFEDPAGRFGFHGVDADLAWQDSGTASRSRVAWSAGRIYDIPLGATRLTIATEADRARLVGEARIPIFSGALILNTLEIDDLRDPAAGWHVDALLQPVPLEALTRVLGWPPFGGRVSGMIPDVRFQNGEMRVGGVLLVRAFDGRVLVRNLRLRDPFGDLPRLTGDLELYDLDLEALTRTFSFGRIAGRLEGEVRTFVLENWRPRSFDAWFRTPEDDPSPHRISQRAVDNLSSLGGGAGVLSRSFLGVFETFRYARLGIGCRLRRGQCEMRGVGRAANGGFYLVKGGGIPRIDVIGYTREVDWDTLLDRLRRIAAAQQAPP